MNFTINGKTEELEVTILNSDVNGNPRFVMHYLAFVTEKQQEENRKTGFFVTNDYADALKNVKKHTYCRKFHNKQYSGGILFQLYNIQSEVQDVLDAIHGTTKTEEV